MNRRFEEIDSKNSNVIYSRVHLARNWDEYVLLSRIVAVQCDEMVERLREGLKGLKDQDGRDLSYNQLDQMQELEKVALGERRILNMACVSRKEPSGPLLPAGGSGSIVLGGDDHIRIQILSPGLKLDESWHKADVLNGYVSERFSYVFDEKYGYLTSFPTNVDTGLRTRAMLHLPILSQVCKFRSTVADMSRFEATIHGLYGEGSNNYESFYEVSSQRTLGQSEKEIVELVAKAATQLNNQEVQVRSTTLDIQRLERKDEAYKSYDVLKYARKIMEKDTRIPIPQLVAGEEDGLMKFNEEYSLYSLIIGIRPVSLNLRARRLLGKGELDAVRVTYIGQNLPEIIQLNREQNRI